MDLKEIALNKSKQRHPWELARIKVVTYFIQKLIASNKKKKITILDVGSGDTFLIKELSRVFGNAFFFAVDIGYDAEYILNANREFKIQNLNITVFNNLQSAEEAAGGSVDLVLLLDVIEHVSNDIEFLKTVSASPVITNDTLFLITVPAYQSLFSNHDVFLGHYRRYNNKLLATNISKANLKTNEIGYFFTFPLVFRFFQKLKEKIFTPKNNATGIGNWKGGKFSSNLLLWMLQKDFLISSSLMKMKIKLPGLSNFAICKKSV
jgi:hypothetical protein